MSFILTSHPTAKEVVFLADNLRQEDKDEIKALDNREPLHSLLDGLGDSHIFKMAKSLSTGNPIAAYGVYRLDEDNGCPWLLVTEEFKYHIKGFVKVVRTEMDELLSHFKFLHNVTHKDHKKAHALIRKLGFSFCEEEEVSPLSGEKFLIFYRSNNV